MTEIIINLHEEAFPHLEQKHRVEIMRNFSHISTKNGMLNISYAFQSGQARVTVKGFEENEREEIMEAVKERFNDVMMKAVMGDNDV